MGAPLRIGRCGLYALLGTLAALASGAEPRVDFDGDGFGDLTVGVPSEGVGGLMDAGAVDVLYGAPAGPGAERSL